MMFNDSDIRHPDQLDAISQETVSMGFDMSCDLQTGAFLRFLASGATGGNILELGTGTGVSTCWLLDGMDARCRLVSVDNDRSVQYIAEKYLGGDPRTTFWTGDALKLLQDIEDQSVDLLFADAWPGKFEGLDLALSKLGVGGIYIVDDLLPQSNWPQGHQPNVDRLVDQLTSNTLLQTFKCNFSSGLLLARKISRTGCL